MKPKSIRRFRHLMFAGSAAALFASHSAQAGTITWDSANATSSSWALGSNWIGGVAPVEGDDVVVTGGGAFPATNPTGYSEIRINSLTMAASTDHLFLFEKLQLGAGGVNNTRECKDSSVKVRTRHWSAALAADGA